MKIVKCCFKEILCITTIILLVLYIIFTFLLINNQKKLLQSQKMGYESNKIAYELRTSSEELTKYIRTYVVTGNPKYESLFWHILDVRNGKASRPDGRTISLKTLMKQLGFTPEEFEKLDQAQSNSDNLVKKEIIAMNAVKGKMPEKIQNLMLPNETMRDFAIRIMHDESYNNDKLTIIIPIDEFIELVNKRIQAENEYYNNLSLVYIFIDSLVILGLIISFLVMLARVKHSLKMEQESSRKLIEKQKETVELVELINQKNTFVAGLTHDLRSPIFAEQKALEVILSKKADIEFEPFFETLQDIYKTNEELLYMVNNYLSLYHYESGKLELNLQSVNIADLVYSAVRSIKYLAKDKESTIDVNIEPDLPLIKVDKGQISSVLVNLISNAIRHNTKGKEIQIKVRKVDNTIEVSIKDNGKGILEAEQVNIFQRYPMKKRKIGTGLGLYLAKQIVEAHSGKIWFETQEGVCTTFIFSLHIN